MKTIIVLIVLIIVATGAYYLVFNPNSNIDTNPSATSNVLTPSVKIENFSFNPSTLTIKTGTQATWTNNDNVPHTITSDSDNLLNSPTLSPGQSFSFTFKNPGTTNYHCNLHPIMKGEVVVTN